MPKARHLRRRTTSAPIFVPAARAALISLAVLLTTLAGTANNFVTLDDGLYLANPHVTSGLTPATVAFAFTSVTDLYWHPLAWLSHAIDFQLYGRDPAGHHFTSLLVHALAAGLLFLVLQRLGARPWLAAAGALLWALHPLRVESFAWVAERKDVLCALFFTATVLAHLHHAARPSPRRYALSLALAALAIMSKPTAVSLPVILLLLDYWPLQRRGIRRLLLEKLPPFAMSAVVMALTVYGQKVSGSMSHLAGVPFWIRLANAPVAYLRYLGKILWPLNLACFYPYDKHPAAVWADLAALGFCGITALAVWQRRRRPWLLVGWLWFCHRAASQYRTAPGRAPIHRRPLHPPRHDGLGTRLGIQRPELETAYGRAGVPHRGTMCRAYRSPNRILAR